MQITKLSQEKIENMTRTIASKENELVIKNLLTRKSAGPDGFPGEFYLTFNEERLPALRFQKIKEKQFPMHL